MELLLVMGLKQIPQVVAILAEAEGAGKVLLPEEMAAQVL
jgi:hypothetical protein